MMMKELNGSELVDYIKVRQAKQIRTLRQDHKVFPKLAIVVANNLPVIDVYTRLKANYGEDILVDVVVYRETMETIAARIDMLNMDELTHAIIVQLPLEDRTREDEILSQVVAKKDVDALSGSSPYDSATALAISWLLAGYGIELKHKKILIVGNGKLVGQPLSHMWIHSGYDVKVVDDTVEDLKAETIEADIIVTATGVPGLITSEMVRPGVVLVDAGTASEGGQIVGDVAADVRERHDITVTPLRGGVGPLTVAALFDNVIRAARETTLD
jgi:methylenetetrahydrofolate dehydrogenase (NADP+) / methenyltetrahydrofolate cyclohydrolase